MDRVKVAKHHALNLVDYWHSFKTSNPAIRFKRTNAQAYQLARHYAIGADQQAYQRYAEFGWFRMPITLPDYLRLPN